MAQTQSTSNDFQLDNGASGSDKRWSVLLLCALAYLYDSLDLQILAISMPVIMKELSIETASAGLLASATMIGTAVGGILFGWIADNYGRKKAAAIGLIEFGVFTVMVYWANSWEHLMILRFLAGIGLGGLWGPLVALISEHWAPRYRTKANGFVLSTFALGGILAALMGRFMLGIIDWRWIFVLTGTAIIAGVIFYLFIPETKKEPAKAGALKEKVGLSECFKGGMAKITILASIVAACQMAGYWGALSWIPTYLVQERGLSLAIMTNFSMFMFVGAFAGYYVYAYLADKVGRRKALMIAFVADAILVPSYVILPSADWVFWLGPIMGLSFGGVFGLFGSYFSALFPARIRATGSGFAFNIGRGFGAVVAPFTIGVLAKTKGLGFGIGTLTIIFLIGVLALSFMPESYTEKEEAK
jgi:MFS family permease